MAAGDLIIGLDGVFLWGAGTGTPGTTATNVDDVQLKLGQEFAETLRRTKRFKDNKPTASTAELSFTLVKLEGDAFLTAILAAKTANPPTIIAAKACELTSGQGFDADWYVGEVTDGQSNSEFQTLQVTLKYTGEQRDGAWA